MSQTLSNPLVTIGDNQMVTLQTGSMDYRNAAALKKALGQLVTAGHNAMLLNMEQVEFVDSMGLGVLLYAKQECSAKGGKLAITGLKPYVSNLVCVTNLHKSIHVLQAIPLMPETF